MIQRYLLLILLFQINALSFSQDCESSITIQLKNKKGGVFANQTITLASKSGDTKFELVSDQNGEATFSVPCNTFYDLSVSNYTKKKEIKMPEKPVKFTRTFSYDADMVEKAKHFALDSTEMAEVDKTAFALPDTFFMKGNEMASPAFPKHFTKVSISIKDLYNDPLPGEKVCISGEKRDKNIVGITGANGKLLVYLPKGDKYTINFRHHQNYTSTECAYSSGNAWAEMHFSYIGTKEIERRKKAEEERIALEEKRLKEAAEEFKKYCKKLGITLEEGHRRKAEEYLKSLYSFTDTVISAALNRNKWDDKLIVCDLTGSMQPYTVELSVWYQLHYAKEKNLQFVFFNDGDNLPDEKKRVGETGGIYYSKSYGIDSLARFSNRVAAAGWGGDCPENNMEALIKGTKMAAPFKELVMIVDNNAPVKDLELLKKFNLPVHIILCGVNDWILSDYLMIAWKTKGSLHTIEQDITKIASLLEGQEIIIGNITYRILGGEFVRITKL